MMIAQNNVQLLVEVKLTHTKPKQNKTFEEQNWVKYGENNEKPHFGPDLGWWGSN